VLLQPPRFLIEKFVLHCQVADLGLQSHHVFVTRVWLPRLQRRLTASEKVIAPSRHRGGGDAELAGDDIDVLSSEQPKDGFGLTTS